MTSHYIKRENNKIIIGTNSLDRMVIDNTGNVGIGTTTPNYILDVNGNTQYNKLYGNTLFFSETVNNFYTNGNVGIGTTTPGYELDVSGDINYTGTITNNGLKSGGMVLLETRVVSSSTATIDFPNVLTTDYHIYKVFVTNMTIDTDDRNMGVKFSTNNGSSYITGGYFHRSGVQYYTSTFAGDQNWIELTASGKMDTGGTYNIINGEFTLYEPTNSSVVTILSSNFHSIDDTNNIYDHYIHGYRKNKESNNAFQIFLTGSGNFLTATISVYGLKQ